MELLQLNDYTDLQAFPKPKNFSEGEEEVMTIYEVTKEDLSELKKEMVDGFVALKNKLDSMQGQYTDLVVKQVELKKDIESLQIKVSSYDGIIKAIIGTIITAVLTALLAVIFK